ncbi:hypothetical protein QP518_04195 [Peptoniphilus harei]|uniref:hypothetical protein n=1 Tax=Peptoniphilus harei TaxID=54005 RepID=UPI00254C4F41|nr:hypothetical protein [Peptoniphilus harei]MDK7354944.1 hypothetical protein [Peptoniphilus harei]MDK7370654.1 hypothetical protein [Peptoniphilus harei]
MKTKEFKKTIESIGLYYDKYLRVEEGSYVLYIEIQIEGEFKIIATVNKSTNYLIGINYQCFSEMEERLRQSLLDAIYKFTSTPIEEREEEKRYIVPLPHLTTSDGEQLFLTHQGNFFPCERNTGLRQTWKEKDLIHIPEEYRDFAVEIDEVGE